MTATCHLGTLVDQIVNLKLSLSLSNQASKTKFGLNPVNLPSDFAEKLRDSFENNKSDN